VNSEYPSCSLSKCTLQDSVVPACLLCIPYVLLSFCDVSGRLLEHAHQVYFRGYYKYIRFQRVPAVNTTKSGYEKFDVFL
jgi:hypothetical protein